MDLMAITMLLPARPLSLRLDEAVRLDDAELFEFCAANRELRIERSAEGLITLTTAAGANSGRRAARITSDLGAYGQKNPEFIPFSSSAGFFLPNGAMRAPDGACVRRERLAALSDEELERFLPLAPDFVVELREQIDPLADLCRKLEEYRDNGTQLGWLIDPYERRAHVYRPGRAVEVLDQPTRLAGDPELPGLVLELARIW